MPVLKPQPTLKDLQEYVTRLRAERGFNNSPEKDALKLAGEVGELLKAIEHALGGKLDPKSKVHEVEGEIADVLIFLLTTANHFGIDVEAAFRAKEAVNATRTWRGSPKQLSNNQN